MRTLTSRRGELVSMDVLEKTARSFGMIAHPIRWRILDFLETSGKPERLTEIVGVCEGKPQPLVSQQVRFLLDAGLLSRKRQGNCVYYGLQGREVRCFLEKVRVLSKEAAQEQGVGEA